MTYITRRALVCGLAGAALLPPRQSHAAAFDQPLWIQVHAIRRALMQDFDGTLRTLRSTGFVGIEMASFPGFRGSYRGDFGALADADPAQLADRIAASGLKCDAAAFMAEQFDHDPSASAAIAYAHSLRVRSVVLTGVTEPNSVADCDQLAHQLIGISDRLRAEGLRLGMHTDQNLWKSIDGKPVVVQLLDRLRPEQLALEMDMGGLVPYHVDPVPILDRYPGRFYWIHLRDGRVQANPRTYAPAVVPGEGVIAWRPLLRAARRARVHEYVVEMETHSGHELDDSLRAYRALRSIDV